MLSVKSTGRLFMLMGCIFWPFTLCVAQSGCIDPQALNYNPLAQFSDGSCRYNPVSISCSSHIPLSREVVETSGLLWWRNRLWTHNDSGGEPVLYAINLESGKLEERVTLAYVHNTDWEALGSDAQALYIGDFGNNLGNRTDLRILVVEQSAIPDPPVGKIKSSSISFRLPQKSGGFPKQKHDLDLESLLVSDTQIHLFSKNRRSTTVRHYTLSKSPGHDIQKAVMAGSCDIPGFITGADISADGRLVALLRLHRGKTFIYLLYDFPAEYYFQGNHRTIEISGDSFQAEAIAFDPVTPGRLFLTNEGNKQHPPQLHILDISRFVYFLNGDRADEHRTNTRRFPVEIRQLKNGPWLLSSARSGIVDVLSENGQPVHLQADQRGKILTVKKERRLTIRFAPGNGVKPLTRPFLFTP